MGPFSEFGEPLAVTGYTICPRPIVRQGPKKCQLAETRPISDDRSGADDVKLGTVMKSNQVDTSWGKCVTARLSSIDPRVGQKLT